MNLIIYSRRRGAARHIHLLRPLPVLALAIVSSIVFAGGYFLASAKLDGATPSVVQELMEELHVRDEQLASTNRQSQEQLDALTARIGQLNAHILRIDALGRRLVSMADLDDGEFNFDEPPARGGPDTGEIGASAPSSEIAAMLDTLDLRIDDRSDQLSVLEQLLTDRRVSEEQQPEGRPVASGWLSSYYGKRSDPFSGKKRFHGGIDFAGHEGSDVLAVAAGVVTWSGERRGYGTMVEVSHGNGLVTRYAHNKQNLVEVGETVKKGQKIALMGRSGRATGPHVHFEVLRQGRRVNPLKFVQR